MQLSRFVSMSVMALIMPAMVLAAVPQPPSSVQPGQVQQHLQPEQSLPDVGGEPIITLPDDTGHKKKLHGGSTFLLKGVKFDGLTAFSKEELADTYKMYIGKQVSLDGLNDIAQHVTVRYRDAGYVLSRAIVPPQDIRDDGVATIRIIEGYINKVIFEGEPTTNALIKSYAERINNTRPLDVKTLERYLLLMQDLPGISVKALLRPAVGAPGASDVVITLAEKKVDGLATLDNRGTRYLGPVQAGLTVGLNDMLGLNDRTQFHFSQTAEFNELHYIQVSHDEQLDNDGTKLTLSAAYTHDHPAYTLEATDLQGFDTFYSASVSHPFIRSRQANLYGTVSFDVHDTDLNALGSELYNDHLRVLRVGSAFDYIDSLAGTNRINFTASQGLNWDASSNDPTSRGHGNTDFLKGVIDLSRTQPIHGPFDLYVAASGQWSDNTLLVGEQFGIGGANYGSAYDPSEIIGDSGAVARTELRYNAEGDGSIISRYQLYSFYDLGKVWSRDVAAGASSGVSLADVGLGARMNIDKPLFGTMEIADPLTHPVAADGKSDYRPRVFFSLGYRF